MVTKEKETGWPEHCLVLFLFPTLMKRKTKAVLYFDVLLFETEEKFSNILLFGPDYYHFKKQNLFKKEDFS